LKRILAPSLLAADFKQLGKQIAMAEQGGAEYLHFDVMDGHFVPSISFGMPVLESIRDAGNQVLDAHLMITEPIRYVEAFQKAGADILTVHLEACMDVKATLLKIKACGMKVGISIKPKTAVSTLAALLEMVDMVLVMTVEPGFGGQKIIPETIDKVRELRTLADGKGLDLDIQVDGGIYHENVHLLLEAGANIIVAGSAVFAGDITANVRRFIEIFQNTKRCL